MIYKFFTLTALALFWSSMTPTSIVDIPEDVEVFYVSERHEAIRGGYTLGRAIIYEGGDKVIYINNSLSDFRQQSTLVHELAHLYAWEKYGTSIRPHGSQFRQVCRELASQYRTAHDTCQP